jgi:hypothetical protein
MVAEFFEYSGTEVRYSLGHTESPVIGDGIEYGLVFGLGCVEV